jgi:receptor protein-tyrosine kinase
LVEVQGANENFLNLRDVYPTDQAADSSAIYIQTQADLIQQDASLEQTVTKLGLQDLSEFRAGSGLWGKLRRIAGKSPDPDLSVRNAVEILRRNISVTPGRNSRIIQIVSEADSPVLAAGIANTLAGNFVEQSIEARQRAARQTYESLNQQLAQFGGRKASRSKADKTHYGAIAPLATRTLYEALVQKADEARIAAGLRQSNIVLAGPAQAPSRPFKPNLPLNLAIGIFGGAVLAIGLVMLQEQTNSVMRVPGEAGNYLTLPELGAIPMAPLRPSWLYLPGSGNGKLHVERASLEHRSSSVSEAFRTTLASILSDGSEGGHPRVLVVTSSQPMEGKTTVVSNLGIALAEISGKVLLIDGDMRRPQLHRVFDQANSWGLSDLLSEQNAIDDLPLDVLVRKTAVPHLYLLPSGAGTENIFSLLHSGRMSRLLPRFRQEFDYVLVDAPPCLEFADARIMARYAEKLMLVVRANHTDRKTAHAAVQRLQLDGIPVMGVILNRWNPAHSDLYRYSHSYGIARQDPA